MKKLYSCSEFSGNGLQSVQVHTEGSNQSYACYTLQLHNKAEFAPDLESDLE